MYEIYAYLESLLPELYAYHLNILKCFLLFSVTQIIYKTSAISK